MNWQKIIKKYPIAWAKYCMDEWSYTSEAFEDMMNVEHLNVRHLFDFFDKNRIHVTILTDMTMEPKFCYSISVYVESDQSWVDPLKQDCSDLEYTRKKAETAAFLKAFENKLNL